MEILIVVILVLAVVSWLWYFHRSDKLLDDWMAERGYEILSKERRWLRKGPFFWWTSKSQAVFRVTVRDSNGKARSGFVRVGGFFLGMFSSNVEVTWDDLSG